MSSDNTTAIGGSSGTVREYLALVWIGDAPGFRLQVHARSSAEAKALVKAEYGDDAVVSVWNEQDASRPRSC